MSVTHKRNRIDELFERKARITSLYLTAGFPDLSATVPLCSAIAEAGIDCIELGMPFSDPVADGPVIQRTHATALQNGADLPFIFDAIRSLRKEVSIPLILMGYLNPVLQYGVERFVSDAANAGIDGVILPDLPPEEFTEHYASLFSAYGVHNVCLIGPHSSTERIRYVDSVSRGFLYAVSSFAVTGGSISGKGAVREYLKSLETLSLRNPLVVGFGIRNRADVSLVHEHVAGAIIGSAFLEAIDSADPVMSATVFLQELL